MRPAMSPSPDRVQTPEEISKKPVSSRSAQARENPSGPSSRPRSPASPGSTPERKNSLMTTVKNTTKAQIFRVERKESRMAPVKAAVKRAASKRGPTRRGSPRRLPAL